MSLSTDTTQAADPAGELEAPRCPGPGPCVNILLVDDEPRNLDVLEAVLAAPGYRLVRACSPDQALLALVQNDFAAIVLDVQMPGMSGLDLAHLIKQRPRSRHIPIIFLTAYFQEDKDVLQGYGAGAVDYLTKPINPQILKSKVGVVVELYRANHALAAANRTLGLEVSRRKAAQEALRLANLELEARVHERTADLKRAIAELRQSEALKGAVLNAALDCIVTFDASGRIVEFNPAAERAFGYTRQQVLGKPLAQLLPPKPDSPEQAPLHCLGDNQSLLLGRRLELPALRAEGSEFPAEISLARVPLDGPPLFTAFLRDITERKRVEAALSEQARLLELSNDAILVRDAAGRIIFWNRGAEVMYGWSRQEALGRKSHELLQTESGEALDRIMARLYRDNRWEGEMLHTRRDGSRITVGTRWVLDRDSQGNPHTVLETNNDITARIKEEERFVRLNKTLVSVMEAIPDVLFVTGVDGQVRFRNPAARRFQRGIDVDRDPLPAPITAELQRVLQTGEHLVPTDLRTLHRFVISRQERYFLSRILRMTAPDNRPFGAVVMLQDVTDLRLLDEVKTNLISTVSHELKTPITSLRTALLLLREQNIGPLSSKQAEMIQIACGDAERLLRTLNGLLDLTRFEESSVGMRLEPVSPAQLVRGAIEETAAAAASVGVRVNAEVAPELPQVRVDRERLLHVLTNFLTNAIKYSPEGGEITVHAQPHDEGVYFSVVDRGPGVPEQYQSRIFERFFRVPGTAKKGAGLGLSIARECVRAHHGRIGIQSLPAQGSEFYFIVPTGLRREP